jgi:hypothetical protein
VSGWGGAWLGSDLRNIHFFVLIVVDCFGKWSLLQKIVLFSSLSSSIEREE